MALFNNKHVFNLLTCKNIVRTSRLCCTAPEKKGLILGVFSEEEKNEIILTSAAERYNQQTGGKLLDSIKFAAGNFIKPEQNYVFWQLCPKYRSVSVVGLKRQNYNEIEDLEEGREAIRIAAHIGCNSLKSIGMTHVDLDDMGDPEAAAEGATLSTWLFNHYKTKDKKPPLNVAPFLGENEHWTRGIIKASSQNLARLLMDTPANLMTPTMFANKAKEELEKNCVQVEIHNKEWAEKMKMNGLLSVTRGSIEPPAFLEITYCGDKNNNKPIVLVGKGVTFDSGGISLKPSANMDQMRADMGGAACVVSTIAAVSQMQLQINIIGLVPLCENMPSGHATKPGDIITMMNGKTVCVDNTDAEGRMILADALTYSGQFNPQFVLDIATLTGAMAVAVGTGATGVFTNSNALWKQLRKAGCCTGDRVWRFPLWKHYTKQVAENTGFDLNNIGKGKGGGSCTAAAFLREFVPEKVDWLHLDMAGVMGPTSDVKYIPKGMTGRPTRTLTQFIEQLACNNK